MIRKMIGGLVGTGASLFAATAAIAQEGPIKAPSVEQMAGMVDKGDTTWMLVSSVLVLLMSVPALALFYGGLVRTKNMLSVLMQVFMIVSVAALVWVSWGYSMAFTSGGPFIGGFSKVFLMGVDATTYAATFSNNVYIPEYAFVIFQMTFACITPALIVGAFAERVKFSALMVFTVLWLTCIYFPMAHMVWYWAGPDFLADAPTDAGYLWAMGALDFAGGTVVHINAGIAGLVGCIMIGKRIGFGKEATPPHSLTMTMIGASLLWVGWFGFNAGSNLEANGVTAVAFINTFVATAAAAVSWAIVEQLHHGKPSMLGAATGAVAGLVAITPASGLGAPMTSIVLGFVVSPICYFFVSTVKNKLKYDDTLDVFGVHCIGGIVGAIATGIVAAPSLGGQGVFDYTVFPAGFDADSYNMAGQVWTQTKAVIITLLFSGIGSAILFFIVDKVMGLRPTEEAEREGLDISEHGERAYNY
ncbi:ammonium transporter [Novosphingobium sp. MMS21-SN21R]|uniref:ammonium transporter n=1 Tax=Novosphingobium sp. MMS21-SN21R TaxID=2969298 RepID=UPI00288897A9|nr:ammonium transporter [Novosphingobium sp. MMS21-SN21R]MDT0506999.1 ammonium transporter [Novosphingobium sp. MMS21-SN21R]MDT0509489.1 ammonium transporter [Novosphingobium sp. MMS21-SN21R]